MSKVVENLKIECQILIYLLLYNLYTFWNFVCCISSVVRLQTKPSYVGLKYLLKLPYSILKCQKFWFLVYFWKKYHKNEQHLRLVTHIFTKLSQNVGPIGLGTEGQNLKDRSHSTPKNKVKNYKKDFFKGWFFSAF